MCQVLAWLLRNWIQPCVSDLPTRTFNCTCITHQCFPQRRVQEHRPISGHWNGLYSLMRSYFAHFGETLHVVYVDRNLKMSKQWPTGVSFFIIPRQLMVNHFCWYTKYTDTPTWIRRLCSAGYEFDLCTLTSVPWCRSCWQDTKFYVLNTWKRITTRWWPFCMI